MERMRRGWALAKQSWRVLQADKSKWGEGAAGTVAITTVTFLVGLLIAMLGGAGGIVLIAAGLQPLGAALVAATVVGVIVVSVVSSALTGIFRVAVYEFAATGQAVAAFDSGLLQTAFDSNAACARKTRRPRVQVA